MRTGEKKCVSGGQRECLTRGFVNQEVERQRHERNDGTKGVADSKDWSDSKSCP